MDTLGTNDWGVSTSDKPAFLAGLNIFRGKIRGDLYGLEAAQLDELVDQERVAQHGG